MYYNIVTSHRSHHQNIHNMHFRTKYIGSFFINLTSQIMPHLQ